MSDQGGQVKRWDYMGSLHSRQRRSIGLACLALSLLYSVCLRAEQVPGGWQQRVRDQVKQQQFTTALQTVEQRLAEAPDDLEAHGWRARLLAWSGRWTEAEQEYRLVLERAPGDMDIVAGLSDVLVWQQRYAEALAVLQPAPGSASPDLLLRRARILARLGHTAEARAEYQEVLIQDPRNQPALAGLAGTTAELRYEVRAGVDVDSFNYTESAQAQFLNFNARWNPRWSTLFGSSFYQRFGETASKLSASVACRFAPRDWLNAGGAVADDRGVTPKREAFFEYGHGFHLRNRYIAGWETSYQQRWLWYRSAQVLTLTATELVYLPKDWIWSLVVTGARSHFYQAGSEWQPAGATRLNFPLYRRLRGSVSFAVGSENFALVDQVGRFAARTYGGGLRYQLAVHQDVSGYVAVQDRSQGRTQNSFGINYGFHF
jgi:Tfp pilus assembly protein PilF